MTRLLLAPALLLLVSARDASGVDDEVGVDVTLRDTGYMIGDLLNEQVEIRMPASMRLDADSLPLPGRVTPWLEVRRTALGPRQASGAQELVITYQIFAEAEQATRAPLPEFKLKVRNGADIKTVGVPAQTFLLSPALPPTLTDRDREPRPSLEPMPLPQSGALAATLASLALALACAGYLLWRYDRLPFLPYAPGPLTRAWRHWRRARDLAPDEHAALLRDMHAALSTAAGETLYPSTLQRLFERAPHLAPLKDRIRNLFAASWNSFYGQAERIPPSSASVLELLRDAADRERGVPC